MCTSIGDFPYISNAYPGIAHSAKPISFAPLLAASSIHLIILVTVSCALYQTGSNCVAATFVYINQHLSDKTFWHMGKRSFSYGIRK